MKSFDSNNDFNINIIRLKERLFIISLKIPVETEIYFTGMKRLEINSH
jgi:hypothetical protein